MRKFLRFLKMTFLTILAILVIFALAVWLFISLSPQFGDSPSDVDKAGYAGSGHYEDGRFQNLIPTTLDLSPKAIVETMIAFAKGGKNRKPDFELPVAYRDSTELADYDGAARLVWFGHSAFLLQMDGMNILIDPMFGESPSPVPLFGSKRYGDLPIEIEKLPSINLIIFSHDHYDHLDYGSILKLKAKTKAYYVPLGVGAHLKDWGVEPSIVHELNWWESRDLNGMKLVFAPSRHFSGRGIGDRNTTLWGSWVIKGENQNIYFSGDGGYGPHFKAIGEKYGPFDFAMIECGQYNEKWKDIHMMPEESVQAALDLQARLMMPIHWGAFTLALHAWTDPIVRVLAEANRLNMPITAPEIGESIRIGEAPGEIVKWWEEK